MTPTPAQDPSYADFERLHVELDDGIARVVIDAPPINVMTLPLFGELLRFGEVVSTDDRVRVVLFTSAHPDFFIAHFDVEAILGFPVDSEAQRSPDNGFHQMCERYRTMPKVTIAQIEGRIGGGGSELAQAMDMRFGVLDKTIVNQMEVPLGILPGGGVALLRASVAIKPGDELSHDEKVGYNIVVRACRSPLTMIAENAGQDGGIVCEKVVGEKGNMGYNALTDKFEDLVKAGVIDPTMVARTALANAASVAILLLTSDALVAEKPKDEKSKKGHGGEYDMY